MNQAANDRLRESINKDRADRDQSMTLWSLTPQEVELVNAGRVYAAARAAYVETQRANCEPGDVDALRVLLGDRLIAFGVYVEAQTRLHEAATAVKS